jgi:hypothetical protein
MPKHETADADFFALVHHVLEAQDRDPSTNRRDNRRRRYSRVQFIAPLGDVRLPVADDFEQILCYDLSPSGFSFLVTEPPSSERLVVALGEGTYIYVTAAVVHQQLLELQGQSRYLIGCRFISRLNTPGGGPLAESSTARA